MNSKGISIEFKASHILRLTSWKAAEVIGKLIVFNNVISFFLALNGQLNK